MVHLTPSDNGGFALPVTQCLHREMGGVESGAASGVDRDRRAAQIKVI